MRTLAPGGWFQFTNLLAAAGVQNGWVLVRRIAGTAPWIAYGVINDGGAPGERTGDGAYVPMYLMCGTMLAKHNKLVEAEEWLTEGIDRARQKGDAHALSELQEALEGLRDITQP